LLALLLALFLVLLIIVMEVRTNPTKLIPVAGFFFLVFLMWACSVHPFRVNWRPVIAGFTFQILLAIFVLKTKPGRYLFLWLGRAFQRFVSFADKGSTTVYGFLAERHIFYFSALPVVIFCSSVVSTLYHFGAIQWFCKNVTVLFRFIIGTSSHETLTAFANIMLSMTEAPLLVRPYLPTLTRSELFCIMTSGFATSSVSVSLSSSLPGLTLLKYSTFASCWELTINRARLSTT
jgi:nucleoside permease NupC